MSDEAQTTTGWIIFIAALGSMFGMIGVDMARLKDLSEVSEPSFIGTTMVHLSTVIAAFVGGKLIPAPRSTTGRVTDAKLNEINNGRT